MKLLFQSKLPRNKINSILPAYVVILWIFIFLFFLRVISQLIQQINPVIWLPPLGAWQGSSLPYGLLLFSQVLILAMMLRITSRHASASVKRNTNKGKWLLAFGVTYFAVMAGRLFIGMTNLSMHPWFQKFIPAVFHLILAAFVLLLAAFHMNWLGNKYDHSEDR